MSIGRSVAWNYAGSLGEMLAGLLLVAYVVRRVALEEYGLLLLAISIASLMYLLDLGLGSLLVQAYVAIGAGNPRRLSTLMTTSFITLAIVGLLATGIATAIALRLPGPFNIPPQFVHHATWVFILVALGTMLGLPTTAVEHVYQAFYRFDRLNQIQVGLALLRVVLTLALLARGFGVVALAALHLLNLGLRLLILLGVLRWSVAGVSLEPRSFDWNELKPLLRLGRWSALDGIARQIATAADSIILGVFGSVGSVAIFGMGSKLPNQLSSLVTRGAIVALPSLTEQHVRQEIAELRKLFLDAQKIVLTGALPVVALGCVCARPLIASWAGETYAPAASVMQFLLIAALSFAMEYSSDLLLYARGEVRTAALIAVVESAANIAVSLLLVFRYGAVGLAVATAITHSLINAVWYTPAACRSVGIDLQTFLRSIFEGQRWLISLLLAFCAGLLLLRKWLSPTASLTFGILAGIAYLVLWAKTTVQPVRMGARIDG